MSKGKINLKACILWTVTILAIPITIKIYPILFQYVKKQIVDRQYVREQHVENQNITVNGIPLKEVWGFDKVDIGGKYLDINVGPRYQDNKVIATAVASENTVACARPYEIHGLPNYTSSEEYQKDGGPQKVREYFQRNGLRLITE